MYLFIEFCVVALPLLAWTLLVDFCMNRYAESIDLEKVNKKFKSFPAKVPTSTSKSPTLYIVTGGSGYIGSWVIRFLILRYSTDILSLDTNTTIPHDLTKHGVKHEVCDLTDKEEILAAFAKHDVAKSGRQVVVYHAAAIQRYFLSWFKYHENVSDRNVEMAQTLVDTLTYVAHEQGAPVYLININDAITKRHPVNWWKAWNYSKWTSISTSKTSPEYVSSYARSKSESESLILQFNDPKTLVTTSIEPHGIVCGYYGESLLSPCLYYKGALSHSWSIPISFLHVEDVARAALLAENKLRDSTSSSNVQGKSFLISNGQMKRVGDMFKQLQATVDMRVIKVNPVLVLLVSYVALLLSLVIPSGRKGWKSRDDSLFSSRWWALTPMRFTTLQLCQIPDDKRIEETNKVLEFQAAYTVEETLQSTFDDYVRIDIRMDEAKKARIAAVEAKRKADFEKKYGVKMETTS